MVPLLSENDCHRLLPLVRARYREGLFGAKMDLICVTENEVLVGRCSPDKNILLDDPDVQTLEARLRRIKKVSLDEVTSIDVFRGGLRTRQTSIRIHTKQRSLKLQTHHADSEHLIGVLHSRLGDKFEFHNRVRLHGFGINLLILGALALAGTTFFTEYSWAGLSFVVAVLPLLGVQIYDHIPARLPWEIAKSKKKYSGKDRSGKKPFRSRILGWGLKIVSASLLLALWLFGAILLGLDSLPMLLLSAPLILVLYLGHQIAEVPLNLVRESDKRAPILYLRSFLDDRQSTLMPESRYARFMGVQPPQYLPSPWRYIFRFNPVRIFRILFGLGVDRTEQELALFFRKHGPFVAIGKPGELFATPGASRMYVTNDEWKNVVLEHLKTSQLIVVQPAKTEGIWWEVENSLKVVDPRKILFCMVNFYRKQNDYEKFRLKVEKFLKHPLPRNLGYARTPTFVYFAEDETPIVQEVSCHAPILWPIIGQPVDLDHTLEPFLDSLTGNTKEQSGRRNHAGSKKLTQAQPDDQVIAALQSREPRWIGSRGKKSAAVVYAVLVGVSIFLLQGGTGKEAYISGQSENQHANTPRQQTGGNLVPLNESESSANALLASTPTDSAGWNQRALIQNQRGNFEAAVDDVNKSIALDDSDAEAYVLRGDALRSLQKWEESIRDYQKAVELSPKHAVAWNNLGYSLVKTDKLDDAIVKYSKAIELAPNAAHFASNRGMVYLSLSQADKAIADFELSLKLDPQQPLLYYFHGQALAKKKDWLEAIKYFNTAIKLDPEIVDAYMQRAQAFVAIGDQKSEEFNPFDFARRDLNEILNRLPDNLQTLLDRAIVNKLDGRLNDSIADTSQLLEKVPDQIDALRIRGEVHYELGQFDKAINDYDSVLRLQPEDVDARLARASTLFSLKRYDDVIADCVAVLNVQPENIDAHQIRGNGFYAMGRYSEALKCHQEALQRRPHDPTSLTVRAQVFANIGQYDLAAAEYQKLVDAQPDNFDAALFLTYALSNQERWDQFDARQQALSDTFSEHPDPTVKLFLIRLKLLKPHPEDLDWTQILMRFTEVAEANPQTTALSLTLGAVQVEAGRLEQADVTLQDVLNTGADPITIAGARIWLSMAKAKLAQGEQARNTLDIAKEWVEQDCPLTVREGEPIPDVGQWWQRVEIHAWMAKAEALLNEVD